MYFCFVALCRLYDTFQHQNCVFFYYLVKLDAKVEFDIKNSVFNNKCILHIFVLLLFVDCRHVPTSKVYFSYYLVELDAKDKFSMRKNSVLYI